MNVLVVVAGGEICCELNEYGAMVVSNKNKVSSAINDHILQKLAVKVDINVVDVVNDVGNDMLSPSSWELVANVILKDTWHNAVLVICGTDSIPYMASALAYIEKISKSCPVIVTGANTSITDLKTDGFINILQSIAVINHMNVVDVCGVFVVFNGEQRRHSQGRRFNIDSGKIFDGTHVKKRRCGGQCYMSFNSSMPYIGKIGPYQKVTIEDQSIFNKFRSGKPVLYDILPVFDGTSLLAFKMFPGMCFTPICDVLDGKRVLLLELYGTGIGTVIGDTSFLRLLEYSIKNGILVFAVSQQETNSNTMCTYESDRVLLNEGIVSLRSMSWESATTKLMLGICNTTNQHDLEKFMVTDITNELS